MLVHRSLVLVKSLINRGRNIKSGVNYKSLRKLKRERRIALSVGKCEFPWEFSSTLMVLVKREQELRRSWQTNQSLRFTWNFHQLSLLDQMRTNVSWELTSESWHESFNQVLCSGQTSRQDLLESWKTRLYESFLNSRALVEWEQELHESCDESWWECIRVYESLSVLELTRVH